MLSAGLARIAAVWTEIGRQAALSEQAVVHLAIAGAHDGRDHLFLGWNAGRSAGGVRRGDTLVRPGRQIPEFEATQALGTAIVVGEEKDLIGKH